MKLSPQRHFPPARQLVIVAATALVAAACSGMKPANGHGANAPAPVVAGGDAACPLATFGDWQTFLEAHAGDDRLANTCEDQPCDQALWTDVDTHVRQVLDACAMTIQANPALATCTQHLRTYLPTWLRMHDSTSYGFKLDNKAYLAAEEAPDMPVGMMKIPAALVAALPDRAKVEAAARDNGWKYLAHDSGLIGGRVFVTIPDPQGRFDQWMLFNFDIDQNGAPSAQVNTDLPVSMLVVQKKAADGTPLPNVRLNFRDHHIVADAGNAFHLDAAVDGTGKCYGCHPSGVRKLLPIRTGVTEARPVKGEAGYVVGEAANDPAFAMSRLNELNAKLEGYGLPDWNGTQIPAEHGPSIGADQGCSGCHDGANRGFLTVSTSEVQLEEKLVTELAMPPSPNNWPLVERRLGATPLSAADQQTLDQQTSAHQQVHADFMAARFPALKAWLLESSCQ